MRVSANIALDEGMISFVLGKVFNRSEILYKDFGVEPHDYFYVKVRAWGADIKVKLLPIVHDGFFGVMIKDVRSTKLDLSTASFVPWILPKLKENIQSMFPITKVEIDGNKIYFPEIKSRFAGVQYRSFFANVEYQLKDE